MSTKRHSARNFVNPINRFNSANIARITGALPTYNLGYMLVAGGGAGATVIGGPNLSGGGGGAGRSGTMLYHWVGISSSVNRILCGVSLAMAEM